MNHHPIIGITCIDSNRGIGYENKLLFRLKEDMQFFKNTTTFASKGKQNAVIMGSKTFESIGGNLPHRLNCVITKKGISTCSSTTCIFSSIEECLESLKENKSIDKIYVIGGESIYRYFMDQHLFDEIFITHVAKNSKNKPDTYFPSIPFEIYNNIQLIKSIDDGFYKLDFYHLKKDIIQTYYPCQYDSFLKTMMDTSFDEFQYLKLLQKALVKGEERKSRNATTFSLFAEKMEFDISQSFPLLTTKKMFFKGIAKELIWFLRGETDSKILEKDGVNIWKDNSSKESLENLGLDYKEGDCGPVYGFQWRNFNASYPDGENGIDQLAMIIKEIKENPNSRRLFMSGWNPCQLQQMVLPPCHVSYQFYVRQGKFLDCSMYQRSGDLFLGVPFNIASTSLLVYIIANLCSLQPGKVIITIGDAHIYQEHVDAVKIQLQRIPLSLPTLKIHGKLERIEDVQYENIEVVNYLSYPTIKAKMVV